VAADPGRGRLLHKFDMAPRRCADRAGVVVGEAAPVESVFAYLVPFFAGDFTGFAADAQRRIGKKGGCCAHARRSRTNGSSTAFLPRDRRPGFTLQTRALVSMMRTFGSSLMTSRSLTTSPVIWPR